MESSSKIYNDKIITQIATIFRIVAICVLKSNMNCEKTEICVA